MLNKSCVNIDCSNGWRGRKRETKNLRWPLHQVGMLYVMAKPQFQFPQDSHLPVVSSTPPWLSVNVIFLLSVSYPMWIFFSFLICFVSIYRLVNQEVQTCLFVMLVSNIERLLQQKRIGWFSILEI